MLWQGYYWSRKKQNFCYNIQFVGTSIPHRMIKAEVCSFMSQWDVMTLNSLSEEYVCMYITKFGLWW